MYNNTFHQDYLDILFDGRNKKYGSYDLRKKYPNRMRNAALIGIGIALLAVATPVIACMFERTNAIRPMAMLPPPIDLTPPPVHPKKQTPPPAPLSPPPPVKPTVKFTPPVVEKDDKVIETEKPPEQTQLKDLVIGEKTALGDSNGGEADEVKKSSNRTGTMQESKAPTTFTYVEQMPAFDGDINAYLNKNIHYPAIALENNIAGRVIVRFVINEDGSISDVDILRGIGGGCDEEAKRVVSSMPPWKPGKQNGRAVKVYFTLPILFKLE